MWKIRPGFAAWLLFALACLVPGWFLREPLAAETQLQCGLRNRTPPIGREEWRPLGPGGVDYLVDVLKHSPNPWRRSCAALQLSRPFAYPDPAVWRAMIEALKDPAMSVRGSPSPNMDRPNPGIIAAAFDEVGEGELLEVLGAAGTFPRWPVFASLWRVRPAMAERIASRIVRETANLQVASDAVNSGYMPTRPGIAPRYDASPWTRERRRRVLLGGLRNPNKEVRTLCQKWLAEDEVGDATPRPGR